MIFWKHVLSLRSVLPRLECAVAVVAEKVSLVHYSDRGALTISNGISVAILSIVSVIFPLDIYSTLPKRVGQ